MSRSSDSEVFTNLLLQRIGSSVAGPAYQTMASKVKRARRKKDGGSSATGPRVKLQGVVTKFKKARGKKVSVSEVERVWWDVPKSAVIRGTLSWVVITF